MKNLIDNKTTEESVKLFTAIIKLVDTTPNDQDLGRLVRKLINASKDGFISID